MAKGDISIRIRVNSRRFRWSLSGIQARLWWWGVKDRTREAWGDVRAWARPGLAPELSNWMAAPWLSRTAGEAVYRPIPLKVILRRATDGMALWAEAGAAAAKAMEGLRAAFEGFSRAAFEGFGRAAAGVKVKGQ